jgi:hypothetical protein
VKIHRSSSHYPLPSETSPFFQNVVSALSSYCDYGRFGNENQCTRHQVNGHLLVPVGSRRGSDALCMQWQGWLHQTTPFSHRIDINTSMYRGKIMINYHSIHIIRKDHNFTHLLCHPYNSIVHRCGSQEKLNHCLLLNETVRRTRWQKGKMSWTLDALCDCFQMMLMMIDKWSGAVDALEGFSGVIARLLMKKG